MAEHIHPDDLPGLIPNAPLMDLPQPGVEDKQPPIDTGSGIPETLEEMQKKADEFAAKGLNGKCFICHHGVFYAPGYDHAELEGQIYSEAGVDEFKISQSCEFCFDKLAETWDGE